MCKESNESRSRSDESHDSYLSDIMVHGEGFQFNTFCLSCEVPIPVLIEFMMLSGKSIIECPACGTEQVLQHRLKIELGLSEVRKIALIHPEDLKKQDVKKVIKKKTTKR